MDSLSDFLRGVAAQSIPTLGGLVLCALLMEAGVACGGLMAALTLQGLWLVVLLDRNMATEPRSFHAGLVFGAVGGLVLDLALFSLLYIRFD